MKTPYCQHCKQTNVSLHKHSTSKTGRVSHMCRECNTVRCKEYRHTPEGKKKCFDAVYRSTKKHYDKQLARMKLNYQVKKGNIVKPTDCESCHENKKLDGHHEDYSKPLEVKWLCRGCHADADKKMRMLSPLSWMIRPNEALSVIRK